MVQKYKVWLWNFTNDVGSAKTSLRIFNCSFVKQNNTWKYACELISTNGKLRRNRILKRNCFAATNDNIFILTYQQNGDIKGVMQTFSKVVNQLHHTIFLSKPTSCRMYYIECVQN